MQKVLRILRFFGGKTMILLTLSKMQNSKIHVSDNYAVACPIAFLGVE